MLTTMDKIKLKLGISHSLKDAAILEDMEVARLEMIRAGCNPDIVNAGDVALVEKAVETYCMMEYSDPSLREKYQESFEYQVNQLRRSTGYMGEEDACV